MEVLRRQCLNNKETAGDEHTTRSMTQCLLGLRKRGQSFFLSFPQGLTHLHLFNLRSMLSVKEGKLGLMSLGESANGGSMGGWMNE